MGFSQKNGDRNMKMIDNLPFCPRCGGKNGKALSRRMNIIICDRCGQIEALEDFYGTPTSLDDWYLFRNFNKEDKNESTSR